MAPATNKLSAVEAKIHKAGLAALDSTITQAELFKTLGLAVTPANQDAINSLLRKNLMTMFRNQKGQISFRFSSRDEAKSAGGMESDEKLVLDQIKDAGNQGIWVKTLKTKTGLHATIITRVVKTLEGSKRIKVVKSVKNPTRKIYMMANIQPSVELTGGPWFTDNELDTEFVDALKKCAMKYLQVQSIPDLEFKQLYPTSATRFLPMVKDVREYITSLNVAAVELLDEHVEALLDLMVYDGTIQKIMVAQSEEEYAARSNKRSRAVNSDDSSDSDAPVAKKGTKGKGKKPIKKAGSKKVKRTAIGDDAEEDSTASESEDDDFNEEEDAAAASKRKSQGTEKEKSGSSKRRKNRFAKPIQNDGDDSDVSMSSGHESEEDSKKKKKKKVDATEVVEEETQSGANFVYRLVKPYTRRIGWTDMTCGVCPSESFCAEPTRKLGPHHTKSTYSAYANKGNNATRGNQLLSKPRIELGFDGMMQGVGMMGGSGAAIGTSNEKWGDVSGSVGGNVAPVNPRDCAYFATWLDY